MKIKMKVTYVIIFLSIIVFVFYTMRPTTELFTTNCGDETLTGKGEDYRGCQNKTKSRCNSFDRGV